MHLSPIVAPFVGFAVAFVCAPAGVSGAFLLLPFQVTVLGLSTPSVTATSLLYNVVATPGGINRYRKDYRLDRDLARLIVGGTLPGVLAGAVIRIHLFRSSTAFKGFVGVILVALGVKLLIDVVAVWRRVGNAETRGHEDRPGLVVAVSVIVGLIGGIYGIGGGSVIAPYLIAVMGFSVYRVAGAALLATFITSGVGVTFYQVLEWTGSGNVSPDWGLGILFGLGGLVGSYVGASMQHRLPEWSVKSLVGALAIALGLDYVLASRRR